LKNGRGKTGKPQAMPISTAELNALIAKLQAERRTLADLNGPVFTMPDGQPIDELKFEYHFRKACKAAKIKNFTFHDLTLRDHPMGGRWHTYRSRNARRRPFIGCISQTLPKPF
jgi:hypothetical protein